ncbi:38.7K (Ac13) [Spodoptera exigua multiple nucleopolyhedrovirus]|nr:38.7K (Ac13) [Spodoptera exigua multiple nucleopolyhedrovirus]CDG72494.1 38.7K (Ac13) [Spodoptera exigua multiple nucleopolyhedrovirus]CDG72631.1 38.7K (Ac13) [Spodoptera exigua multiple nucleopolyhedrovirus]CDG72768.1 38.7K (Ac13) [Spodoptera exigua multiple nucleopolyhedrovirus]
MALKFFAKLFGYYYNDDDDDDSDDRYEERKNISSTLLSGFSYLFKTKRLQFDDQFSFTVDYLFNDEVWIAGNKLAEGLGFRDPQTAIDEFVDGKYKRTINELVFNNSVGDTNGLVCVNKHGVLQLIDRLDFKNKAEFTAWIIEEVYVELENKFLPSPIDDKLNKVLAAVDTIKQHNNEALRTNDQFKDQVIERFEWFNVQISELNKKMSTLNNVDELYRRLQDYHKSNNINTTMFSNNASSSTALSSSSSSYENNLMGGIVDNEHTRYETVRFPRDTSKHPRLSVFVKPSEEGTDIAFITAQQRRHNALKRKFNDMEMIYDSVHPNPQLAMHCINEELDIKQFDYTKRSRRVIHVNSPIEIVKSFINENL